VVVVVVMMMMMMMMMMCVGLEIYTTRRCTIGS